MTSVAYLSSSFSTSDLALVLKSCVVSGRGSLLGLTRQVLLPFVPPGERVTEPEIRVNVRRLTRLAHKQRRGVHVGCAQTRPTVSCALCSASATLSVCVRLMQLVVSCRRRGSHRLGVESVSGHDRGYGVAKWMAGRERHLLLNTNGLVLAVRVHSTDLLDRTAGVAVSRRRVHGRDLQVAATPIRVTSGGTASPGPRIARAMESRVYIT